MRGLLLILALLAVPFVARAQDATAPFLEMEFPETEAIPGQPLTLRLTVLVPSWMPTPPVWPGFEAPNLMVRLPDRATTPISRTIGGETWSGITRRYEITPMIPGRFALPADEVRITYAEPGKPDPIRTVLTTEPLEFTGIVPPGAEGMDPFMAAQDLTLTQEIEGSPETLQAGDSFARTITAEVDGLAPMFLPVLTPEGGIDGLRAYPDSPVLTETENRGIVSGSHSERVAYVAETGLVGRLPGVSIRWYDLDSGTVQVAELPELAVRAAAPPAPPMEPGDWLRLGLIAGAGLIGLAGLVWLLRRLAPPMARWWARRKARYRASARHAFAQLRRAIARRDLAGTRTALAVWTRRRGGLSPEIEDRFETALLQIGRARHGPQAPSEETPHWKTLRALCRAARRTPPGPSAASAALPPLNPQAG